MPPPPRQLALIIQLDVRDIVLIPTTVFFMPKHCQPQALQVMTRFGIDTLHVAEEEFVQHALIGFLGMLVDGFPSQGEDGARLEPDRLGRSVVAEVVEEGFEILCWGLGSFLALEGAFW